MKDGDSTVWAKTKNDVQGACGRAEAHVEASLADTTAG